MGKNNRKICMLVGIVVVVLVSSAFLGFVSERMQLEGKSTEIQKIPDLNLMKLPLQEKKEKFILVEKKDAGVQDTVEKLGLKVVKDYGYYMLIYGDDKTQQILKKFGIITEKPEYKIEFATITFTGDVAPIPANLRTTLGKTNFYLVQLIANPCEEWINTISAHGKIYTYYRQNTYLVKSTLTEIYALSNYDFVWAIYPYHPYFKIGGNLAEFYANGKIYEKISVDIDIEKDIREAVKEFESKGANVIKFFSYPEYGFQYAVLSVKSKYLFDWLLVQDYVLSISDMPEKKIMNNVAARIIGASALRDIWRNGVGLPVTGAGQVVAIADTGLDTGNPATVIPDFAGRVKTIYDAAGDGDPGDPDNANLGGHGTHVAGSVAASGVMSGADTANHIYDGSFAGMAPEAQIHFESIGTSTGGLYYDSITNMATRSYNDGARVWTNSWGSSGAGYTADSKEIDTFIWNHKDFLTLFAAGNDGPASKTLDNECTAKSALAVGATQNARPNVNSQGALINPTGSSYAMSSNMETLAYFSSRGPTDGGYIKPDVCAPGTGIVSTRASTVSDANAGFSWIVPIDSPSDSDTRYDYGAMQGTSMATPVAAGACVLVRDYYMDVEGSTNVSAALIRATMIGGAKPMPGYKYFGIDQGYGRLILQMHLFQSLRLATRSGIGRQWVVVRHGSKQ
ncbi:MAG: S8 family serine peptidase [Thermoplasmata archaeon]